MAMGKGGGMAGRGSVWVCLVWTHKNNRKGKEKTWAAEASMGKLDMYFQCPLLAGLLAHNNLLAWGFDSLSGYWFYSFFPSSWTIGYFLKRVFCLFFWPLFSSGFLELLWQFWVCMIFLSNNPLARVTGKESAKGLGGGYGEFHAFLPYLRFL